MRSLRLDYAAFITEYRAALECSLHFKEFLQLSGISHFMLNDRLKTLAQRGVVLPKLRGMRNRPMGVKPKPKAVRKPSRWPPTLSSASGSTPLFSRSFPAAESGFWGVG
jgi:hypothetical protein